MTNVLITSAGRRRYLVKFFKEALLEKGGQVFTANMVMEAPAMFAADHGIVVPQVFDVDYVQKIFEI